VSRWGEGLKMAVVALLMLDRRMGIQVFIYLNAALSGPSPSKSTKIMTEKIAITVDSLPTEKPS
jgi:hypothetical protein